jgi:hypothetical protein
MIVYGSTVALIAFAHECIPYQPRQHSKVIRVTKQHCVAHPTLLSQSMSARGGGYARK